MVSQQLSAYSAIANPRREGRGYVVEMETKDVVQSIPWLCRFFKKKQQLHPRGKKKK
jgi:hypothetical protein